MNLTDKITITNEDNMELMARYPDNYFDLAIVDPPYGIGLQMQKFTKPSRPNSYKKPPKHKGFNDSLAPPKEYFYELSRVSVNQIVWGGQYLCKQLKVSGSWIFWNKLNGEGSHFADGELAWTSFTKSLKMFSVSPFHNTRGGKDRIHPCEKPVKLYEWLLMNYATCKTCNNEGQYYEDVAGDGGSRMLQICDDCYHEDTETNGVRILDTHLGSGSIAIACHNLGFELTACELDKDYFEASIKRIQNHISQQRLF